MPDRPLVSILIDNYNYAALLGDAIESALSQSYPHVEVVVVDDGSTDDSRRVIERFGTRIVPVLKANGGQGSAFNAALAASRGEILCFLDSDDVFTPDKVERVVELFERHPEVLWVKNGLAVTDGRLRPVGVSVPTRARSRVVRPKAGTYLESKVRFVVCSAISVRRRAAERFLPIPEARLAEWRYCADAYVGFWCAVAGDCYEMRETLGCYRRQDHQRFLTDADIVKWLERQISVEERLARSWSARVGRPQIGSDVLKHRLVAESLRGHSIWSSSRRASLWRGLRELARIAGADPPLAARQAAALAFAFVAPHAWARRLRRTLALPATRLPSGAPASMGAGARAPTDSIHDYT